MTIAKILAIAALVVGTASVALAQSGPPPEPTCCSRAPRRRAARIGTPRTRRQSGAQNRAVSGCSEGHRVRNP
jgi:hypothetical protein